MSLDFFDEREKKIKSADFWRIADVSSKSSTHSLRFVFVQKSLDMISIVPRSFFGLLPLQSGAEMIAGFTVFNKASSIYGLGALFTGRKLTVMEWILNVLGLFILPICIIGYLAIRKQRPLLCLSYAYFYFVDTFVSLGFTIFFIVHWFVVGQKKADAVNAETEPISSAIATAATTATAAVQQAVTSTISTVAKPRATHPPTIPLLMRAATDPEKLKKSATTGQELAVTIVFTSFVLLFRFYFMMVIIGYARAVVRRANLRPRNGEPRNSRRAQIQFILLRPFEKFWTGISSSNYRAPEVQHLQDKDFDENQL